MLYKRCLLQLYYILEAETKLTWKRYGFYFWRE